MGKLQEMQHAEARRLLRDIEARWSALDRLVSWTALPSDQRYAVTGELERLGRQERLPACEVAVDAFDAIPAALCGERFDFARDDVERLITLARRLLDA